MLEHTLQVIGSEWIILLVVVVVLLFGARKIPEIARSIGRARGELERGRHESEEELRKWREGGEKKEEYTKVEAVEEAIRKSRESGAKKEESTEREKLEEAAKALGLAVEGKSDEEIRAALKKALEKSSP